jgi:hypothetical protein
MFPKPPLDLLNLSNNKELGKAEKIVVKEQPFKEALRLTTLKISACANGGQDR